MAGPTGRDPKAIEMLRLAGMCVGRMVRVETVRRRFNLCPRNFRRWMLDAREAGCEITFQGARGERMMTMTLPGVPVARHETAPPPPEPRQTSSSRNQDRVRKALTGR